MKLKRLSSQAFEQAIAHTALGAQARAILHEVLVSGRAQVDVACEFGVSKQRVNSLMGVFKQAYIQAADPGMTLISVELELPEGLAIGLRDLMHVASNGTDQSRMTKVVNKLVMHVTQARKELVKS
jgi:hypothetical protein